MALIAQNRVDVGTWVSVRRHAWPLLDIRADQFAPLAHLQRGRSLIDQPARFSEIVVGIGGHA